MDKIILSPIELSELLDKVRQVVKEEVLASQKNQLEEKFLSPAEVCKLFTPKITRPTLNKLCHEKN